MQPMPRRRAQGGTTLFCHRRAVGFAAAFAERALGGVEVD